MEKIELDGPTNTYVYAHDEIDVRGAVREQCFFESARSVIREISPSTEVQAWLGAAAHDDAIAWLLRLAHVPHLDWVTMYKILEIVQHAMGGDLKDIANKGWPTEKKELERFKHTANSIGAVGDVSRHGKEVTRPPSDPMPLEDQGNSLRVSPGVGWVTRQMGKTPGVWLRFDITSAC